MIYSPEPIALNPQKEGVWIDDVRLRSLDPSLLGSVAQYSGIRSGSKKIRLERQGDTPSIEARANRSRLPSGLNRVIADCIDNVCREIASWHQRGIAFVWKDFHVFIGNISDSMHQGIYDVCWAAEVTVNKSSALQASWWLDKSKIPENSYSHFNCLTPRFLIWP